MENLDNCTTYRKLIWAVFFIFFTNFPLHFFRLQTRNSYRAHFSILQTYLEVIYFSSKSIQSYAWKCAYKLLHVYMHTLYKNSEKKKGEDPSFQKYQRIKEVIFLTFSENLKIKMVFPWEKKKVQLK